MGNSSSLDSRGESRVAVLHEIALALSAERDRRRLFEGIVHGARRLLGTPMVGVWSWDPERGEMAAEADTLDRPLPPPGPPSAFPVCAGPALLGRHTVTSDDMTAHPHMPSNGRLLGMGAGVATPLLRQGTPIGVILAAHPRGQGTISTEDVSLLEILAGHVALALANAETVASAVRRIAAAEEMSLGLRGIIEAHERDLILTRTLDCATTVLGADRAAIYLSDGDQALAFAAGRRLSREYLVEVAASYKRSVGAIFLLARTPVYVADMSTDPRTRVLHASAAREGLRSLLVVPLVHRDALIGGLALYHDLVWRYQNAEIDAARRLADQLSIALANARLFERTQHQLAQMRALEALLRALVRSDGGGGDSVAERAQRSAQALVAGGGATRAWVWAAAPGGLRLDGHAGVGALADIESAAAAGDAIAAGEPVTRLLGSERLVAAPMVHGGATLGALVVSPPRSPPPQDRPQTTFIAIADTDAVEERLEFARTAAAQIATALARAEGLDALADAAVSFDAAGRVAAGNRKLLARLGREAGEVVGWTAEQLAAALRGQTGGQT